MSEPDLCLIGGCARPVKAKRLCRPHYEQAHRKTRHRPERILRNRARSRALTLLADRHPDEFTVLEASCYAEVKAENDAIADALDDDTNTVVPLRPGPRGTDQPLVDRVAVAIGRLCSACATFHAAGHDCPKCSTRTEQEKTRKAGPSKSRDRIRRWLTAGRPPQWVVAQGEAHADVMAVVREIVAERGRAHR